MNDADDANLVRRVRAGDIESYARLVERYRDAIYGLAYSRLRNYDDAQDVAQQTFLHAYQRLDQLRTPAHFGSWLRQVAVNLCRMRQQQQNPLPITEMTAVSGGQMEHVETRLAVEQMLACLSEASRLTLTLFYLRSYSLQEIAAFLEVPVTTVKSRLRNARMRLRKEMWEMLEETVKPEPLPEEFARQVMQMLSDRSIFAVAFSPDGKTLASGGNGDNVTLWQINFIPCSDGM